MALSEQSRAAFMRAAVLLANGRPAGEREKIFRNAQSYADAGKWIPALTAEQFPLLFHPANITLQADLSRAVRSAQDAGELSKPLPSEPQGLWPTQWAAWPGMPPIPADSPLLYWLPDWLPSCSSTELEAPLSVPVLTAETAKPLQIMLAQEAAVLFQITRLGYDPLALPQNPSGKPGVKAEVRHALSRDVLFIGPTVFDKAWERLSASREIVIRK